MGKLSVCLQFLCLLAMVLHSSGGRTGFRRTNTGRDRTRVTVNNWRHTYRYNNGDDAADDDGSSDSGSETMCLQKWATCADTETLEKDWGEHRYTYCGLWKQWNRDVDYKWMSKPNWCEADACNEDTSLGNICKVLVTNARTGKRFLLRRCGKGRCSSGSSCVEQTNFCETESLPWKRDFCHLEKVFPGCLSVRVFRCQCGPPPVADDPPSLLLIDPPTEPPTDPPTEPPTDPPTEPPTDPPTEPPTDPPTEPPTGPATTPSGPPPTGGGNETVV